MRRETGEADLWLYFLRLKANKLGRDLKRVLKSEQSTWVSERDVSEEGTTDSSE